MTNVLIESTITLEASQVKTLQEKISKALNDEINLTLDVDPDLIGGLRIVTPHKTIDMSIAARLNQLTELLQD